VCAAGFHAEREAVFETRFGPGFGRVVAAADSFVVLRDPRSNRVARRHQLVGREPGQ
jgi:hypothetical protein